jgi:hypothetical protein
MYIIDINSPTLGVSPHHKYQRSRYQFFECRLHVIKANGDDIVDAAMDG